MTQTETQNNNDPFADVTLGVQVNDPFASVTLDAEPEKVEPALPEAGTYTQNDLAENDYAYSIAEGYMRDRFGDEEVDGKSREDVIDSFLNNRRGVVSGNTVRGLAEIDYINDIQDDEAKKTRAAAAYKLYENMAGIFSKETTVGEKAEGVMDFARSVLLDPANLLGGLIGKAAANGSIRVGTSVAKKAALQSMQKEGTKKTAEKVGTKVFADGVQASRTATKAKIGSYVQQTLGKTAAQRLATKKAITEIGITTGIDAAIGTGMEYLYQDGLVDVDAQEDINYLAVGIAAAGGIIMGGVQAGLIARRGMSDTAVPTMELSTPDATGFLSEASQAIDKYVKQKKVDVGRDWKTKLEGGAELSKGSKDFSHDFFKVLILGHNEGDEVIFKGMTQTAFERGFVWAKRFEDDKFTNWMADIIADVSDKEAQGFIKAIEKATGNKIKVRDNDGNIIPRSQVTGRDIGDILSYKMSEAGSTLGLMGQSAKQLGLSITDMELKDLYESALDAGFIRGDVAVKTIEVGDRVSSVGTKRIGEVKEIDGDLATVVYRSRKGKVTTKKLRLSILKGTEPKAAKKDTDPTITGMTLEAFQKNQDRLIRLLVAHPSTSALNVVGWGTNTALQSATDMSIALVNAGYGTLQKLAGQVEKGAETQRLAKILMESNMQRVKFLLDPDMTYTAFESALQRNSEALQRLNSVLPGGVEGTNTLLTGGKFSPGMKLVGLKTDNYIDMVQKLTLVQAQDGFTKSQEFLFQMDKKLRAATGKGWNEFYRSENIGGMSLQKYMGSKEYRTIEANAVEDTLEAIFSKSYKGEGLVGTIAGGIENARKLPVIGMAVPFGRFFNATVAFTGKNAPGVNMIAKGMGFYDNMTMKEAFARTTVSAGALWVVSNEEIDNVKKGLPLYATATAGGEVINQQFDFPISAYRAGGRIWALMRMGEKQQAMEAFKQFRLDFGLSGLLRNLDKAQRDTLESITLMVDPERRDVAAALNIAGNTLASQFASPVFRAAEPLNIVAGLARGEDAAPIDRKQNNKLVNNAFRYIDNIIPLFMGEPLAEARQTAAGGTADIQSTKMLGIRNIRLTDTQRVMNRVGIPDYKLDSMIGASKKVKDQAPQAGNTLSGIFFDIIESESSLLLESSWFDNLTQEEKLQHWKGDVVPRAKDLAKTFLRMQYSGPEDVTALQYDITSKFPKSGVQKGLKELNLGDLEDLEPNELFILQRYLETEESLRSLRIFKKQTD